MKYKITATVPTPVYHPSSPAFSHHLSTLPSGRPYENGEAGHVITVSTESKTVASSLVEIYKKLFKDVKIERVNDENNS